MKIDRPVRADEERRAQIAGFTAESTATGRKPRLEATIITPGKPVPASGEPLVLNHG
jgi:hypothetical protein